MKRFLLWAALGLILSTGLSQAPQKFRYQTVVRNNSGELIMNQAVSFKIGIMHDIILWDPLYIETHVAETNEFGLVSLEIGNGAPILGTFIEIDWPVGDLFLEIGLDIAGGEDYTLMGSMELLSVPYALYAEQAGDSHWQKTGSDINYSSGNVGIGTGSTVPEAKLHVAGPFGEAQLGTGQYGIYGLHTISGSYGYLGGSNVGGFGYGNSYGLWGSTLNGNAIYGTVSGSGYAGYFSGKGYFSGNLGIGASNPTIRLQVDGGTDVSLAGGGYVMVGPAAGVNISMDNNEIMSRDNGAASPLHINREGGNTLFNELGGYVGIGTNAPSAKLEVSGTIKATSFSGDGSSLTGVGDNLGDHAADQNISLSGHWLSGDGGDEGIFVANNGNVGIGSSTPGNQLYIKSPGSTFLGIERLAGDNGGISHYVSGTSQARWIFPFFRGWQSDNLIVRLETSLKDVMTFWYSTGNVGINTPFDIPASEKLHVEGNIYLTGDIMTAEKTATLSLGPPEFVCGNNSKGYTIIANFIRNDDILFDNSFYAAVQLPDGATLTSLTSYWIDNAPCTGELELQRIELASGGWASMATPQYSIWNSGAINSLVTSTFNISSIDNDNYAYMLKLNLCADPALWFLGCKIEYTYTTIP